MLAFIVIVALVSFPIGFAIGWDFAIGQEWPVAIALVVGFVAGSVITRITTSIAGFMAGIFVAVDEVRYKTQYSSYGKSKIAPPSARGAANTSYDDAIDLFRKEIQTKSHPQMIAPPPTQSAEEVAQSKASMWDRMGDIKPLPPVTDR